MRGVPRIESKEGKGQLTQNSQEGPPDLLTVVVGMQESQKSSNRVVRVKLEKYSSVLIL